MGTSLRRGDPPASPGQYVRTVTSDGRPSLPATSVGRGLSRPATGAAWSVGLQLGAALLGATAAGRLVEVGLPMVALAVGVRLLRRRPEAYLEFVLWLWLLTPFVRRAVDLGTGFSVLSPVMLTAPLVTCLALIPVLQHSGQVAPWARPLFAVALPVLAYGAAVGTVRIGPAPAAAALLNWLPPIAIGLWLAGSGPATSQVRAVLRRTAVWGSVALGGYALVQFFVLPAWDVVWMQNAELANIGRPLPREVRIFSALNSPGPFAVVAGALLTVLLSVRHRFQLPALVLGVLGFALSLVRASWTAFVLTVVLYAARRAGRGLGRTAVALAVPVVVLVAVGGPVQDVVLDRLERTAEVGTQDESLGARVGFYVETVPEVLRDPAGNGLGSVGTATRLGTADRRLSDRGNFDSGLLEFLYVFGAPAGALLLAVWVRALLGAWRRAGRGDAFDVACAAAALGIAVQLVFVNVLTSVTGVLCLILVGHLLRSELDAPARGRPADRDARQR
jgi:hypothetical protein